MGYIQVGYVVRKEAYIRLVRAKFGFHTQRRQLQITGKQNQGIMDSTGMGTFAKEPKFAKLLLKLKPTPVRGH